MRPVRFELTRLAALVPKTSASANFATGANITIIHYFLKIASTFFIRGFNKEIMVIFAIFSINSAFFGIIMFFIRGKQHGQ